jgi:hypothetical protein
MPCSERAVGTVGYYKRYLYDIILFQPEPLNLMFCDESEYSLAAADSGDENVMEGGLTIRQHQQHQQGCNSGRLPRVSVFEIV